MSHPDPPPWRLIRVVDGGKPGEGEGTAHQPEVTHRDIGEARVREQVTMIPASRCGRWTVTLRNTTSTCALAGPIGEHVDRNVVQDDGDQSSDGTLSF
jgi:hypothetical protein